MSSIGSEVINGLEDALFGSVSNETITSTLDPFEEFDPFADDAFFYPRVIHDSEPCKWLIQHKISHINIRLWDLLFFVPNSTFLSFLMFGYSKSKQRLKEMKFCKLILCMHCQSLLQIHFNERNNSLFILYTSALYC